MIIPTKLRPAPTEFHDGHLDVATPHDEPNFISIWQDDDIVLVYRDQVDALIAQLQKFKENA